MVIFAILTPKFILWESSWFPACSYYCHHTAAGNEPEPISSVCHVKKLEQQYAGAHPTVFALFRFAACQTLLSPFIFPSIISSTSHFSCCPPQAPLSLCVEVVSPLRCCAFVYVWFGTWPTLNGAYLHAAWFAFAVFEGVHACLHVLFYVCVCVWMPCPDNQSSCSREHLQLQVLFMFRAEEDL